MQIYDLQGQCLETGFLRKNISWISKLRGTRVVDPCLTAQTQLVTTQIQIQTSADKYSHAKEMHSKSTNIYCQFTDFWAPPSQRDLANIIS